MDNPFSLLVPLTPTTHTYIFSLLLSPCLSTLSPELQPQGCRHLLDKDTFVLLVEFLLGPSPKNQSETSDPTQHEKAPPRRWSSNQVKEFGPLHCTWYETRTSLYLSPKVIPMRKLGLTPTLSQLNWLKWFLHQMVCTRHFSP